MTTSYTSLLGLALPVQGELTGSWGDTVNNSITSLLDTAVAGTTTLSTDADVTLTTTTGASNQARQAILLCTGARTALRTITAPAQSKAYIINNATTGGFSVKIVGVGPTTGVTIVAGEKAVVAWNGSDFVKVAVADGAGTFTSLTVSGNATLGDSGSADVHAINGATTLAVNSASPALTITQTGAGNALTATGNVAVTGKVTASAQNSCEFGTTAKWYGYNGTADTYFTNAASGGGNGIFTTATSTGFLVGGGAAVTVDANGNAGLGVTPSAWGASKGIDLGSYGGWGQNGASTDIIWTRNAYWTSGGTATYKVSSTPATYYAQTDTGVHVWASAVSGTAGNAISFTQTMTLNENGTLATYQPNNLPNLRLDATRSSAGSEEVLRIAYTAISPNSTSQWFIYASDSTAQRFSVRSNGGIANYQANDVNLSDRREKTNFSPAGEYLSKICAIPVQTFNYIDQNMEDDPGLTLGVVAQDVQAVAPELVMESNWAPKGEEPKIRLSIYQTDLQYALMKCIQEQQAQIESLLADKAALLTVLASVDDRLAALEAK